MRQRIERDAARVTAEYPRLALALDAKQERAALVGTIVHREEVSGVPTPIEVRIELRPGYPETEPIAYEMGDAFEHGNRDGHVLSNGQLCLWLPPRSQWAASDPDALLRFVDQVLVFADRHLVWKETGRWPGGEWAHGDRGWVEYIQERLECSPERLELFAPGFGKQDAIDPYADCPCGSGAKYRFCHRELVRAIRRVCTRNGAISHSAFAAVLQTPSL